MRPRFVSPVPRNLAVGHTALKDVDVEPLLAKRHGDEGILRKTRSRPHRALSARPAAGGKCAPRTTTSEPAVSDTQSKLRDLVALQISAVNMQQACCEL